MDFNVSNFNIRLRTIKLREIIIVGILIFLFACGLDFIFNIEDNIGFLFFFLLILFFLFALKGTSGAKEDIYNLFKFENSKEIVYILIINLLFSLFFISMVSSLDVTLSFLDPNWVMTDLTPTAINPVLFILEAISAVIFAPIVEELAFRGVLFNRLKIRIGIIPAILLSSGIFAIGHEFGGIISAFVFGICMCIIYLKTDNIFMSMSIHFLNNLIVTIMELFALDTFILKMPILPITAILSIISGVLILIYIFVGFKKIRHNEV